MRARVRARIRVVFKRLGPVRVRRSKYLLLLLLYCACCAAQLFCFFIYEMHFVFNEKGIAKMFLKEG